MLFTGAKDWKQYLSLDDEEQLNKILKKVMKYRGAYKNSDEIKVAQLWCAVLELAKQNQILQKRSSELQDIIDCLSEKMRKKDKDRAELVESLEKF